MPRFSRLRTAALEELAHELRFAPSDALERALDRIEALAAEIDPATAYPLDWAAFKVTAFRREFQGTPATIPGKDLLADLPALAERLSAAARLDAAALVERGAIDRAGLIDRWRVSPKTLERYKLEGLVGRRAIGALGKPRLLFMPAPVRWFERTHAEQIDRAASFTRLGSELEARMVRRAARYRRRFGCSLNQAAKRIAERFGRSHEAVRQLLRRAGRDHDDAPRFDQRAPITSKERAVALRAVARGLDPASIASRWGRPRTALARAVLVARADRLWSLRDAGRIRIQAEALGSSPEIDRALAAAAVASGLGAGGSTDLLDLVRAGRVRSVIVGVEESSRAIALAALLQRADTAIRATPRSAPTAATIDRAETLLRWATLVKVELVRSQVALMIETIEGLLGAPLEEMPGGLTSASLRDLLVVSFRALAEAVDQFDPTKGGRQNRARLAAPATLGVTRAATRWIKSFSSRSAAASARPGSAVRAAGRLLPGVFVPDWTLSVSPSQRCLWPDPRVRAVLSELDPASRALLGRRYGWSGLAPATLVALADEANTTVTRLTIVERRAIRSALVAARTTPRRTGPA